MLACGLSGGSGDPEALQRLRHARDSEALYRAIAKPDTSR
jgi:hypothetical protein